jgi:hypothetical protein
MITNSSNQGGYRKAINNLENDLNSKTNSINSEITAVKNRVSTVETEITPIARGGTGATSKETAIANLTKPIANGNWQNAQVGISLFKYEAADKTTYNLPYEHCFVLVMKESNNRGTAIAYTWVNGTQRSYRNNLHDDTGTNTWKTWQNENTVVSTYSSGTNWYRIWSDGWIEQGGEVTGSSSEVTVTLLKPFKNTNYFVNKQLGFTGKYELSDLNTSRFQVWGLTASSFKVVFSTTSSTTDGTRCARWYACGY